MPRTARTPKEPITKGQIQLIKIAQKELGIEDDDYRSMLISRYRVSSCTQLTRDQAGALIDHFERLGFATRDTPSDQRRTSPARSRRPSGPPRSGGNVIGLASPEEHEKIAALAALITWQYENGLQLWLKKRLGITKVRTSREAWLAIEGLKAMFVNSMAKKHGKAWWTYSFKDQRVMRFIAEHCPAEYR